MTKLEIFLLVYCIIISIVLFWLAARTGELIKKDRQNQLNNSNKTLHR